MISRKSKENFYRFAGPLMKLNGWRYKLTSAPRKGNVKVHLGPGQRNYIEGWINIDANMFTGKCDLWADLRNPLPFYDNSVDAFYSHHVIEHLPKIYEHLVDCFRCLKPGGAYRVGGPNGDEAIKKFVENDKEWFSDWPTKRYSIGGRFENFIFCKGEHLTILTFSMLKEMMQDVGFTQINSCLPVKETRFPTIFDDCKKHESELDFTAPKTLIVEGIKPF